jgi:hypothetical protein
MPVDNNGVLNSNAPPWTRDTHDFKPGTNIHGGTFVQGNVNNVHRSGEAGTLFFAWN